MPGPRGGDARRADRRVRRGRLPDPRREGGRALLWRRRARQQRGHGHAGPLRGRDRPLALRAPHARQLPRQRLPDLLRPAASQAEPRADRRGLEPGRPHRRPDAHGLRGDEARTGRLLRLAAHRAAGDGCLGHGRRALLRAVGDPEALAGARRADGRGLAGEGSRDHERRGVRAADGAGHGAASADARDELQGEARAVGQARRAGPRGPDGGGGGAQGKVRRRLRGARRLPRRPRPAVVVGRGDEGVRLRVALERARGGIPVDLAPHLVGDVAHVRVDGGDAAGLDAAAQHRGVVLPDGLDEVAGVEVQRLDVAGRPVGREGLHPVTWHAVLGVRRLGH